MPRGRPRKLAPAPALSPAPSIRPSINVRLPSPATEERSAGDPVAPVRDAPPTRLPDTEDFARDFANNADLVENMHAIHGVIHAERPVATHRAYAPKQAEFQAFCRARTFRDGDTVTEQKLLLFLTQDVVERPLRGWSRKVAPGTPAEDTRLQWKSVRGYITAVTDLWQQQRVLGMNNHPSPRESLCREYIRSLQRKSAEKNRATYADKGQDTLLDGYSEPELRTIAEKLWQKTAKSPASAELYLRTLTDLLLSHYMLARGDHRRGAEISDLFTFEFPGEGATRCMPLIFTTRGGKTNQHGRLETAGAFRSRDPDICLIGAVAFYLLFRWDLSPEPFPDFGSPQRWYNTRLIKANGTAPAVGISYNTQRYWVSQAFDYAGVVSAKKTHAGRSSGAKTAELRGVSEAQIRRAGRWNADQMVGCYLDALPRKFMRSIAGHPMQMGLFEIPRAIPPPETLLSMIWPELDQWKDPADPNAAAASSRFKDLAATGTINLLFSLREVVLQDSVFFIDRYPESPVWNHPVFRHPDYRPYARQVLARVDGSDKQQPDRLTLLSRALPELTQHLTTAEARQRSQLLEAVAGLTTALTTALTTEISGLGTRLTSSYSTYLQKALSEAVFQIKLPEPEPGAMATTAPAVTVAPAMLVMPDPPNLDPRFAMQIDALPANQDPPQHRMSRAVNTVEALWEEWMTGLPGQPAISALDSRWGSRWRAGRQSEVQWYSLRLEVIREIRRVAKSRRIAEVAAMHTVASDHRQTTQSLDAFCKRLRAGRKLRDAVERKVKVVTPGLTLGRRRLAPAPAPVRP
jgi:hypothetical protein